MKYFKLVLAILIGACTSTQNERPILCGTSKVPIVAKVLGVPILTSDPDQLRATIMDKLLQEYARNHGLSPSQPEIDAFLATMPNQWEQCAEWRHDRDEISSLLTEPTKLNKHEREQQERQLIATDHLLLFYCELPRPIDPDYELFEREMMERMAGQWIQYWKVNLSLYKRYGGRVIFQQAGLEPLDAYHEFLRDKERTGAFRILNTALEKQFWDYFEHHPDHYFIAHARDEGLELLATPFWLRDNPVAEADTE